MVEHAVAATELVSNTEGMFVSIRNASVAVNHVCTEVPLSGSCSAYIIPANETTLLGPFLRIDHSEVITLAFADIADLYINTFESDFILTGVAEPAITLDW